MELSEVLKNSYGDEVTPKRVEFWFNLFNEEVFEGILSIPMFTVRRMRGYSGWCVIWVEGGERSFEIQISKKLNLKNLLEVLGHEMLHLYQAQVIKNYELPEPTILDFQEFQNKFAKMGLTVII